MDLTGDDRATIFGALLWVAEKLKGDHSERARALWTAMGRQSFKIEVTMRRRSVR
ncbi:putative conjugal transfer protein traD (fragment) [Bradyrhizobium sp. ORS 285]